MTDIPITVRKLKLSVPLPASDLPPVPLEGPIGDLTLRLSLEGSDFEIAARVNGKSYRRMIKTVVEKGAENVVVVLQGDMVAAAGSGAGGEGGGVRLESAGFQVVVKTPKPEE